jgi:osmotically-inducible protein OsmY
MTRTQHSHHRSHTDVDGDHTDHGIKAALVEELTWTPNVNADRIGVCVVHGTVTLSGQAANYPEKQAASSAALRVRGVLAVVDEITVHQSDGRRSDSDLAGDARSALENSVSVPPGSVTVSVLDHVLTLAGTVAWQHERTAAQRAVGSLPGVAEIDNTITLAPPVRISPIQAKARITAALVRNARLDAQHIEVVVSGTEVRLTGKVASWAERHQAEYAGWSMPGVTHVDNRLAISTSEPV